MLDLDIDHLRDLELMHVKVTRRTQIPRGCSNPLIKIVMGNGKRETKYRPIVKKTLGPLFAIGTCGVGALGGEKKHRTTAQSRVEARLCQNGS